MITNTPILLMIFKRPEQTGRVFERIRKAKPAQLFISADGPRNDEEAKLCRQTRDIIKIDWPCEVKALYRNNNVGCDEACISGISWFFDHVDEGIILEDDCLPDQSFFPFCEEILRKYRDNENVMHVGGNFFLNSPVGNSSYYFSHIPHIWGWATWKRAWKKFVTDKTRMANDFNAFKRQEKIKDIFNHTIDQKEWLRMLDLSIRQEIGSWDFRWTFTVFNSNGLCINPNTNLVSNIGAGQDATHKSHRDLSGLKISSLPLPLTHPSAITANSDADRATNKNNFKITRLRVTTRNILEYLGLLESDKRIATNK